MQIDELLYHLHHPESLAQFDDETLKTLIEQYPYLETLKSAYLKKTGIQTASHQDLFEKITQLANLQYSADLNSRTMAPAVFDLKALSPNTSKDTMTSFSLPSVQAEQGHEERIHDTGVHSPLYAFEESPFLHYLESLPKCTVPNETAIKSEPVKDIEGDSPFIFPTLEKTNELIASSLDLKENIGSESLAILWASQGKPALAIQIYEKLILENPEKSATFAAKIEKLKSEYSL